MYPMARPVQERGTAAVSPKRAGRQEARRDPALLSPKVKLKASQHGGVVAATASASRNRANVHSTESIRLAATRIAWWKPIAERPRASQRFAHARQFQLSTKAARPSARMELSNGMRTEAYLTMPL